MVASVILDYRNLQPRSYLATVITVTLQLYQAKKLDVWR